MTVKELKELLRNVPDSNEVWFGSTWTEGDREVEGDMEIHSITIGSDYILLSDKSVVKK